MAAWSLLDAFGIFVFALSGGLAAARRRMDPFGFLVLSFLPAVGGGTLRDLILDRTVFWIDDRLPLLLVVLAATITYFFSATVARRERLLAWCDALGLSVFAVLGARWGLLVTDAPTIAVMMGVMTAVAGGLLRDVVCNELPLILHREIYATAAVAGALVYVLGIGAGLDPDLCLAVGALTAFFLRAAGILRGWSLPAARG
jgi:uncharacterized membrane protein YeiH